jgi:predicted metal-dependent hydrolase
MVADVGTCTAAPQVNLTTDISRTSIKIRDYVQAHTMAHLTTKQAVSLDLV